MDHNHPSESNVNVQRSHLASMPASKHPCGPACTLTFTFIPTALYRMLLLMLSACHWITGPAYNPSLASATVYNCQRMHNTLPLQRDERLCWQPQPPCCVPYALACLLPSSSASLQFEPPSSWRGTVVLLTATGRWCCWLCSSTGWSRLEHGAGRAAGHSVQGSGEALPAAESAGASYKVGWFCAYGVSC